MYAQRYRQTSDVSMMLRIEEAYFIFNQKLNQIKLHLFLLHLA